MRTLLTVMIAGVAVVSPGATLAGPLSGQGTWETTLQARDLDGDGVADAFFDTVLNITWLQDANVNGASYVPITASWVNNLVVGGVSDWRLPRMVITDLGCFAINIYAGGTDCGYNVRTKSGDEVYSEMAHLWYETLGNKSYYAPGTAAIGQPGWDAINTGEFENLQTQTGVRYWFEQPDRTVVDWSTTRQWAFYMGQGYQGIDNAYNDNYAMAVHAGDVGVALVPEPETLALVVAALFGLAGSRRRPRISA